MSEALVNGFNRNDLRFAVDSKNNTFVERRIIMQFKVLPELYDWFFNGKSGYRAQYWVSPENGIEFNKKIIQILAKILIDRLPKTLNVRRIVVMAENDSREEKDIGEINIHRDEILKSLCSDVSKIWICERLYSLNSNVIEQIGFITLLDAERSPAKLIIPRWKKSEKCSTEEGLRAPFPSPECAWLDLKGGFLDADGNLTQIKAHDKRADKINECGWT